jgi:hypothetical protein
MDWRVARAWRSLVQKGEAVCWCERLVIEPGSQAEPCWRGGLTPALLQAPQSAYRIGCVAAAPPTRREGRLRREGLTRPEASSTQHVQSLRREAPSGVARPSGVGRAGVTGSARERGACTAHRRRKQSQAREVRSHLTRRRYQYVHSQVQCAPREQQERQEKKQCSQGLDNCGHIEGLSADTGYATKRTRET